MFGLHKGLGVFFSMQSHIPSEDDEVGKPSGPKGGLQLDSRKLLVLGLNVTT